jgi:hypothetical protein
MQINPYLNGGSNMEKQTFAQRLSLPLLPSLVCLSSIKGFDAWLLHQVHRPNGALASSRSARRVPPLLTLVRSIAGIQS